MPLKSVAFLEVIKKEKINTGMSQNWFDKHLRNTQLVTIEIQQKYQSVTN